MYEPCLTIGATCVLSQNIVGLVSQETATMRAYVIVLETLCQLLALLGYLRCIAESLDEKDYRRCNSNAIEQQIPRTPATGSNTQGYGYHRDEPSY
jgi:hypothetical protein